MKEKLKERWEKIKLSLQREHMLSDISFKTWIKPLEIYDVEEDVITLLVPSDKAQSINYINSKFYLPIKVSIAEAVKKDYDVRFVLEKDLRKGNLPLTAEDPDNSRNYIESKLKPNYNFDNFIVGSNNNLAHAAALAVAETPGEVYNPLFIYGGAGLGKTHLMHAIGNFVIENDPSAKVLYVPSEYFINEFVEAIRTGNESVAYMKRFRDKYRNIDVFMIDDIQFIIGKARGQEEFFNTFERLYQDGKQIVVSCDKPAKDLSILDERLSSRLNWGLTVDMQAPDYETRVAILEKKRETNGYNISDEIIEYVAKSITSSVRELEGALNKINAYRALGEIKDITVEKAKSILEDMVSSNNAGRITPQQIMDVVCEHMHVKPEAIKSRKRSEDIVIPRQLVMYLCVKYTGCSSTMIGEFLGKDHSTVLHGVSKIEDDIKNYDVIREKVEIIKKKLNIT